MSLRFFYICNTTCIAPKMALEKNPLQAGVCFGHFAIAASIKTAISVTRNLFWGLFKNSFLYGRFNYISNLLPIFIWHKQYGRASVSNHSFSLRIIKKITIDYWLDAAVSNKISTCVAIIGDTTFCIAHIIPVIIISKYAYISTLGHLYYNFRIWWWSNSEI